MVLCFIVCHQLKGFLSEIDTRIEVMSNANLTPFMYSFIHLADFIISFEITVLNLVSDESIFINSLVSLPLTMKLFKGYCK